MTQHPNAAGNPQNHKEQIVEAHQEASTDGQATQGRDPRQITGADLEAWGRPRVSRGDAIRAKCIDCCCGSPTEVRRCGDLNCALWPFRMGSDPYRERMGDDQRAAAAERLRAIRGRAA
jgi:hypothetical protein